MITLSTLRIDMSLSTLRYPVRPTRSRALLGLILLAALLVPTGCAYNYAGQEGDEEEQKQTATEDPNVVQIEEKESSDRSSDDSDDAPDGQEEEAASKEPDSESCGVELFKIYYYDASTQITKKIDCDHREVVSVNRSPISQTKRQSADSSGLPEQTWYLLVDPKGIRAKFLTNDELVKISREFNIQFLGRDQTRNLLIYEYRGDL